MKRPSDSLKRDEIAERELVDYVVARRRLIERESLHEAGHCLMAWATGNVVVFVTLPDPMRPARWGRARNGDPTTRTGGFHLHREERALCSVAGTAAERVHSRRKKARVHGLDCRGTPTGAEREHYMKIATDFFRDPRAAAVLQDASKFLSTRWGKRTSGTALCAAVRIPEDFWRAADDLHEALDSEAAP